MFAGPQFLATNTGSSHWFVRAHVYVLKTCRNSHDTGHRQRAGICVTYMRETGVSFNHPPRITLSSQLPLIRLILNYRRMLRL